MHNAYPHLSYNVQWVNIANLLLTLLLIFSLAMSLSPWPEARETAVLIFAIVYGALLLFQVMLGIAGRPSSSKSVYFALGVLYFAMVGSGRGGSGRFFRDYGRLW